jgi:eukaryotic-like serine/threonine-protein kinase
VLAFAAPREPWGSGVTWTTVNMDSDRTLPSPKAPPAVLTGNVAEPSSSANPALEARLERGLAAMATSERAGAGRLIDGKYVIESVLGEGGMSRVFEATHCLTGRRVALKWLYAQRDSSSLDPRRLLQEARAIARIEHPNVVQVLDLGFVDGRPYLVMERLRGQGLDQRLLETGGMSAERAVELLAPVLGAAHAFHSAGVVHRDLKPANLFVVDDGVSAPYLKILDFGVASLSSEQNAPAESMNLTAPGTAVGTPCYMAPEQLRRDRADARSDVFALGAILYEMITGKRPFPARDITDLVVLMVSEDPEQRERRLTRDVPRLGSTLARALAHKPGDRFQSAKEFQLALASISFAPVAAVSPDAPPPTTHPSDNPFLPTVPLTLGVEHDRAPSTPRFRRFLVSVIVGAAVLAAGVAIERARSTGVQAPAAPSASLHDAPGDPARPLSVEHRASKPEAVVVPPAAPSPSKPEAGQPAPRAPAPQKPEQKRIPLREEDF